MIEGLSESITFTGASITKYAIENVLNFLDARINENEAIIACIFRLNCASVPEERSAVPLKTEQSSVG